MLPTPPTLRRERDRFVAFAFAAADLLIETDAAGVIVYAAGAAQRLAGCDAADLPGRRFAELLHADDRAVYRLLAQSMRHGGRLVPTPMRLAHPGAPPAILGGCTLPGNDNCANLTLSEAVTLGEVAGAGEPTLTREDFMAAANRLIRESAGEPYKLSLVAIDGLDRIKSQLPEDLRRGLTTAIERQLQTNASGIEAVGEVGDGRYGLLHKRALDATELRRNVEGFGKAIDPSGASLVIHAATMELDKTGLSEGDAARALVFAIQEFASKGEAAFTLSTLRGSLDTLLRSASERVASLRSTVATGSFRLAFQPVVELGTRALHHVEALARFPEDRTTKGVVAFAEASGLITDFDIAVCQRAIALMDGADATMAPVAVNLSGRSLESRIFGGELLHLLDGFRAEPRMLLFEITESAQIAQVEEVNNIVQTLRQRGFRVCLDDFGAGASSLHYLRGFDVDFIKIDGAFARCAADRSRDHALLRRIVDFCRDIHVEVIVEMIETEAQAEAFRKLRVGYGQGYLYGAPGFDIAAFPVKPTYTTAKRKGFTTTWM
jgi:EAL domain-containing protein (putative c-di-GMP-specific phosphodiesterase class I)